MSVESASFVSQLDAARPDGAVDGIDEGDDHLRLIKAALTATFPTLNQPITATPAQINAVTTKANRTGDTFSGAHDYSAASLVIGNATFTVSPSVPTPANASSAVPRSYVDATAFSSALPSIGPATKGKTIINDGVTARWGDFPTYAARTQFFLRS
jgi:hypothetical protein